MFQATLVNISEGSKLSEALPETGESCGVGAAAGPGLGAGDGALLGVDALDNGAGTGPPAAQQASCWLPWSLGSKACSEQ